MEKQLSCRNLWQECDYVVRNEPEEEILDMFAEHVETVHDLTFTKEMRDKAKSPIRNAA